MRIIGNRILIKYLDLDENITAAGIVLPGDNETFATAEILYLGDDEKIKEHGLQVGDKVATSRKVGLDVEIGGIKYRCIELSNILAVL